MAKQVLIQRRELSHQSLLGWDQNQFPDNSGPKLRIENGMDTPSLMIRIDDTKPLCECYVLFNVLTDLCEPNVEF